MNLPDQIDLPVLRDLAVRSAAVTAACSCQKSALAGWTSMPLSLPDAQLRVLGTLATKDPEEAGYEEYLPNGVRYASEDAPIAPAYFPYNRSTVSECLSCGRCYLRYTEGGGYFVDNRIRLLDPSLIVDVPPA
jgi:hypothetical protein